MINRLNNADASLQLVQLLIVGRAMFSLLSHQLTELRLFGLPLFCVVRALAASRSGLVAAALCCAAWSFLSSFPRLLTSAALGEGRLVGTLHGLSHCGGSRGWVNTFLLMVALLHLESREPRLRLKVGGFSSVLAMALVWHIVLCENTLHAAYCWPDEVRCTRVTP